MQGFISHFNQSFPPGFDWGLTVDLESYDTECDTAVIFGTEWHENNIFISHPDKHKRNRKIDSTIYVTYVPTQIN